MIPKHTFSRSLAGLSAIAALTTGIALTAAPSTARAETRPQIVMSDGDVDCPACELLAAHDQDGLSFRNVVADVQNGNQVVITADVAFSATAGRPRAGSVVFSALMGDGASGSMDYTDDACTPSQMSRQAGDQACAAISRALRDAAAPGTTIPILTTVPSAPTEGIIMRDGGVCDPIRHMGC
jgi:hypothetical protein